MLPPHSFYLLFCWQFGAQIFDNFLPYLLTLSLTLDKVVVFTVSVSLYSNKCHLYFLLWAQLWVFVKGFWSYFYGELQKVI